MSIWHKNQRGFTLIETIVALALISIVFVPLLGVFVQVYRLNKKEMELLEINLLQQSILEKYKALALSEDFEDTWKHYTYYVDHVDKSNLAPVEEGLARHGLSKIIITVKDSVSDKEYSFVTYTFDRNYLGLDR